ncbi:MAG TPA: DUF4142 domain-containing protein [Candidatus Acidoferrales bacterium]|nr:DUF4142 domain-containing protein [Candidatus Acidoferrales bacterium]
MVNVRALGLFVGVGILLAGVPGIGRAQSSMTGPTTGGPGNPSPSSIDRAFVPQALRAGYLEVQQAAAELRGGLLDPSVAYFARRMIADHTAADSQLAAVAQNLGIAYPKSLVEVARVGAQPIGQPAHATPPPAPRSVPAFLPQRQYMQEQVQSHQRAIALFENEVRNGGAQQLRTVAAAELPQLRAHLTMAQQYVASGTITPVATPTPPGPGTPP